MIKDTEEWTKFEKDFIKNEKLTLNEKYAILESMFEEAIYLKIIPLKDPLEDLDHLIKFVKEINSV
ncbi:hypothetical protein J7L48_08355 [bacterium]|nr:hypothetical protein [bacterium]